MFRKTHLYSMDFIKYFLAFRLVKWNTKKKKMFTLAFKKEIAESNRKLIRKNYRSAERPIFGTRKNTNGLNLRPRLARRP